MDAIHTRKNEATIQVIIFNLPDRYDLLHGTLVGEIIYVNRIVFPDFAP